MLAGDQEIECIPIAEGKEMVFGDLEIRAKQRRVNLKGKEIELTTREFDVLYTLAYYHDQVLTTRQIYKAITGEYVMGDYYGIERSVYSIRKNLGAMSSKKSGDMDINLKREIEDGRKHCFWLFSYNFKKIEIKMNLR